MNEPIRRLPYTELEVMQAVWNCTPPVSKSDIESIVYTSHPMAETTLQTLLTRLSQKGFLCFKIEKRKKYYSPLERCSEDIELSCDETLLLESSDENRMQYANLLLNSSQDSRGFTTCLSATSASIRYRLKNIVSPKERSIGVIMIALISFILLQSYGQVAIAFGGQSVREQIPIVVNYESIDNAKINGLNLNTETHRGIAECTDENALTDYISNLRIARMSGNYTFEDYEKQISSFYSGDTCDFLV